MSCITIMKKKRIRTVISKRNLALIKLNQGYQQNLGCGHAQNTPRSVPQSNDLILYPKINSGIIYTESDLEENFHPTKKFVDKGMCLYSLDQGSYSNFPQDPEYRQKVPCRPISKFKTRFDIKVFKVFTIVIHALNPVHNICV